MFKNRKCNLDFKERFLEEVEFNLRPEWSPELLWWMGRWNRTVCIICRKKMCKGSVSMTGTKKSIRLGKE